MKKALAIALVLTLISIPLALATVVDSRENGDLTEVEIIDVVYTEDLPTVPPMITPAPVPTLAPPAESTVTPAVEGTPAAEGTPEAEGTPAPGGEGTNTPPTSLPTPAATEAVVEIIPADPDDEPPAPPVVHIVEPPKEVETLIEEVKPTYELTITVVSIDGTPIGDPIKEQVEVGQEIDLPSLTIENLTPTETSQGTMPPRDTEITLIYVPDDFAEEIISIGDYETPLGLGASMMNVGVCVE